MLKQRELVAAPGPGVVPGRGRCRAGWLVLPVLAWLVLSGLRARAADYYVSPSGDDGNPGTEQEPFATITHGLEVLETGDRLIIRAGVYRLPDESEDGRSYHWPDATPDHHVVIQAYPGEHVVILGSRSTEGRSWEDAGGGLYRMPADFLAHDPKGMFRILSSVEDATRIEHVMVMRNGERSHADVADLTEPGTWTKADDSGAGCGGDNAGCYIYLRPYEGVDPNGEVYELSQRRFGHFVGCSYLEIRGLVFFYMQNTAFGIEGGEGQVVENNVFGHISNGNDNSYAIFVSYGGGTIVRGNEAFDSVYWGGFPNSKGITFMNMDPDNPPLVEENYVHDIIGQGIATKSGASNVVARRNVIVNVGFGMEPGGSRCHWTKPDCTPSDPEFYPGGRWKIYENVFIGCEHGISMAFWSETREGSVGNQIYNNVFLENTISGVTIHLNNVDTVVANNIFVRNARGIYLNHGNGDETVTIEGFLDVFTAHHNLFFENEADYFNRPNWAGPSHSGTGYTVEEVQQDYGIAEGSLSGDPLFVSEQDRDFHLQEGSPAKGAGDGSFYGVETVDMGIYPFGDGSSSGGDGGPTPGPDAGPVADSGPHGPDGGSGDAGASAGSSEGGCGCRSASWPAGLPAWLVFVFLLGRGRGRRSARPVR